MDVLNFNYTGQELLVMCLWNEAPSTVIKALPTILSYSNKYTWMNRIPASNNEKWIFETSITTVEVKLSFSK